jgi:phage baseplate assembly protein W
LADVPHFALPFRYEGRSVAVVEQDTVDDVAVCVESVLRTRPGDRDELPAFGAADPTFTQTPLDTEALVAQIEAWEPRARVLVEEDPDRFDATVRRVRVDVTLEDELHG